MQILRTVPNIFSHNLAESRRFYETTLGYRVVMDLDWIVTFASPTSSAVQLSVLSKDPSGHQPTVSVEVDDVDAAYTEMQNGRFEVVYLLNAEPWGVRRFFVRDPAGTLVNVVSHAR